MAIRVTIDPRAFDKITGLSRSIRRVIFASHTDLDHQLRQDNPFDTGFSASSWWAMHNGQPADHVGNAGGGRGSADPAVLLASIGGTLTMANSAKYIRKLNEGWSPQAPAGWVEAVANGYQDFINRHVLEERARLDR